MDLNIINQYDVQVKPEKYEYRTPKGRKSYGFNKTRAEKDVRYHLFNLHKELDLESKIRWGVELIKMSLSRSSNPVVSCSFGIDSVVTLYLVRQALVELGRDPSDVQVIWNNTLNEFQDVRVFAKQLVQDWNLNLIETKPKMSLMKIIDKYGSEGKVDTEYLIGRKGDRRGTKPLSEKCCGTLKHEPMRRAIKENNWDLVINGLRADESTQRLRAGLRDGDFFYSTSEWKSFVCRPIMWMREKDIWDMVEKYDIPYNELYEKNLVQKYPEALDQVIDENINMLKDLGIDITLLREQQLREFTKRQSVYLMELGFKIFTPRTGCLLCPIPIKYGYLQWMREYYPKVYDTMIYKLGYGEALLDLLPDEVKEDLESFFDITLTEDTTTELLKEILEYRPCTFDTLKK
ncbi:phosphoadenosine phosphosulfate reductase [Bacillus phage v_B-Bak10]|uniref:Phosphoadenosine phosphosulfate reductase n=1 Tax=Bacillus phage v_B-Bak10 TaxID=2094736 RepID=A0A385IJY9_9CAUD|nr:phosphoadenosine phosphosulfate reductase [Bacillus phage v_B-Bak10]AXY83213.1 phosphoadenosine phosphosulfate reductase [Bacillus phage v_B-Bak10]